MTLGVSVDPVIVLWVSMVLLRVVQGFLVGLNNYFANAEKTSVAPWYITAPLLIIHLTVLYLWSWVLVGVLL